MSHFIHWIISLLITIIIIWLNTTSQQIQIKAVQVLNLD